MGELGLFMLFVPLVVVLAIVFKLSRDVSAHIKGMEQQQKDWLHFLETGDDYPWRK